VPPFYDSLLGKLIVHDEDRASAIRRLERALSELTIEGLANDQADAPGARARTPTAGRALSYRMARAMAGIARRSLAAPPRRSTLRPQANPPRQQQRPVTDASSDFLRRR